MKDVKVELEELKEESESGKLSPALVDGRKPRGWIWAASLAAAAMLVSAGGWLWWTRGGRELPPPQVVQLTSYPGSEVQPCLSPDGDKVAFTWDGGRGANLDIYVKQVGEANALRLTTDPAQDQYPVWSPDAKRVAFQRSVPGGVTSICVVTVLGATEQKLMDLRLSGPMAWSPDGKWLAVGPTAAFISEVVPSPGIYLIPAAGGEPRRITNPKPPELHKCPSFSPDGRLLAYVACSAFFACDVYIQPLDSGYVPKGTPQRITRQGLVINGLTWSRDGESLVYGGSLGAHRVRCLWRVGLRAGEPPQRLDLAGFRTAEPSIAPVGNRLVFSRELLDYDIWRYQPGGVSEPFIVSSLDEYATQFSPDGSRVVFSSLRSGEVFDIWVAKADGSNPVQLTNRMGRHQSSPSWSPDSRWIALESQGQDGQWDIYVIDATGGQPRRVTSEPSDDYLPVWSRDGKWIYFSSTRTGRNEIWRVASGGGQAEQVTRNGGYYAFESTDGKELFYLTLSSSPLFAMPLAGGPERQVLDFVAHLSVVVRQDGIYYIGRRGDDGQYPLSFFQFSTGASRLLTRISGTITNGLTLSPDGKTFLFPMSATAGADLMLVENFR